MKTTILKITLLLFLTTLISCSDNENLTNDSTGDDTFSCYINGDLYIPSAGTGINGGDIRPFNWSYSNLNNSNVFNLSSLGDYRVALYIVEPILGGNILNQELIHTFDSSHSGMIIKNTLIFYNTKNNQNNGIVNFTKLSDTKAVGTFECTLYNDAGEELNITNGKFNLSLDSRTN
ncbi:hypothetical protein [Tenacibaculum aquimarinum]|uniref:hypothetical protein n=1 Tax=Tenacibaculum aquimarinum TaxID=2910675 RepID=UPI001F0A8A40|nr:hypothetical protein [Tenacibaculum aquimarinum]MCH3883987.1 hypothetical protein [Tenacibaculum aquimarinum]